MKAFFCAGNKRSGTTLFQRLLNLHPEVLCTEESDVAWALYNIHRLGREPQRHERDDGVWLRRTMDAVGDVLQGDPVDAYFEAQLRIGKRRSATWVGDKKPVQYADPLVAKWLVDTFDGCRFLHIVRHPAQCIASMQHTQLVPWWSDDIVSVARKWAEHERWALSLPNAHHVRYEDLCDDPVHVMRETFEFLELEEGEDVKKIRRSVAPGPLHQRPEVSLPDLPELAEIMEHWRYE